MKDVALNYIREALHDAEKCLFCSLEGRFERRFIDSYLSEHVMDPKTRQKVIENRGFCNYHSYKMFTSANKPSSNDGLGMALTLKSVAEQLLVDVKSHESFESARLKPRILRLKNKKKPFSTLKLSKTILNEFNCPACHHISEMMQIYMRAFLQEISQDESLWKLYEESSGMCIPHYVMVLQIASESFDEKLAPLMKKLVEKQIKTLEKMFTELSTYIEKQDYHFSSEERAKSERTIGESLTKIVGRQGTERVLTNLLQTRGIVHET
ncbi:MAG: DUF6062 family protein [Candidatus Bathyarchaeia archaeon]